MASRYNEPPLSHEHVMNEAREDELQTLLQRYEAATLENNLMEQDNSLIALAEYYKQAENYDKSLTYFEKLLVFRLQIFGPNSQSKEVAYASLNVGFCLIQLKRYWQSLQSSQTAMSIWETQQPTQGLAYSYLNYGIALQKTGQYNEALEYYEKSMQVENKLTSGDTEDKADTLYIMGLLYHVQLSNYTKSLDYCNEALTMYRNVYGINTPHIRIADCLHGIADTHHDREDYSTARSFYTEALDQYKEIYHNEPYDDDIERTTLNLGIMSQKMCDYSAAEVYFRELIRIGKVKYGRESRHEELLLAYGRLIMALKGQKKMEEAREIEILHRIYLSPS